MAARRGQLLVWVLVTFAASVLIALSPSVQARGKALVMLAEAVGVDVPRPFAPPIRRIGTSLDGVTGHLYVPAGGAVPVLLVPGAARLGKDDPRIVRLARSIARAGRTVFVPDMDLAQRRLVEDDIDAIVRAGVRLSERAEASGRVAMLGISYGGSYALVAAADPRLVGRLAVVATFGAYFDLRGVLQAATTGVSVVGGRTLPWQGHPLASTILREQVGSLLPEPAGSELRGVLRGAADPSSLSPDARAMYELVTNEDPRRTFALAAELPETVRGLLERFSPSTVAAEIDAPVIAMHSTDDPAVPYAELLRLERAVPARTVTVEAFRHVDFRGGGPTAWLRTVRDVAAAWRFAGWFLEAQE